MEKQRIDFHASVMAGYCEKKSSLLLSRYDSGYPKELFRGSANLIGGNFDESDLCPEDTLIREISEEYNPNHGIEKFKKKVNWESQKRIRAVRSALLNFEPAGDYFLHIPKVGKTIEEGFTQGINSFYFANIPEEVLEIVEENLRRGTHLSTEGGIEVFKLDNLLKGKVYSTAWATAPILNSHMGIKLPYDKRFRIDGTDVTKSSFKEYFKQYDYNMKNLKLASEAKL